MKKRKEEKQELKLRYSEDELNSLKEKAKKSGKSVSQYQKDISMKAKVKIEVKNE